MNPLDNIKKNSLDNISGNQFNTQKPLTSAQKMARKYNLPETTIGKVDPQFTPEATEPSFWNKTAKTVLPKGAEKYFGLSQPVQTAGDRVREAEDRQQSYFRKQRREENIAGVTEPVEKYTPPTNFVDKLKEVFEYGGYAGNVWTGFIKPAIGTISEQVGLQIHNPKLREWGEQFTDTVLEKEERKASAQSMADVPGMFEGGLKDPRFYSKTMSQAVGFMTAILGTSIAMTAVTRNPVAGAATAYAVGGALESSSAYRSMLERDVSPSDANTAAQIYGTIATVIENSTGIRPAGGLDSLAKDFAADAAKNSGVKNFFKKWAEEGVLEEGSQQLVENLVTKFVDKNQKVFDDVLESMISGSIGALPVTGGGYIANQSRTLYKGMTPEERQAGFAKIPGGEGKTEDTKKETIPQEPTVQEDIEGSPLNSAQTAFNSTQQSLFPDIAETVEPLEKVIEGEKRTPNSKKINIVDKLRTPWRVMRKLGVQKPYRELINSYENYLKELPVNMQKIADWAERVPEESNKRIFQYLDGKKVDLNSEETRVAGEIKAWLETWADRLNMKPDERISQYITHIFPMGKKSTVPEELISLIRNKSAKSIYNPFQLERKGAEGYTEDTWAALEAYAKRATRKANIDPALQDFNEATANLTEASQMEYLEKRISTLNMRPTVTEIDFDNAIHNVLPNIGPRPTRRLTTGTRKMVSRAKIGGSATTFGKNLTQGINTWAELGSEYTMRGYVDLVKFGDKELVDNSVLRDSFYKDKKYNAIKKWSEKFDKKLFINMEASELVNRGAAYYGAKSKFLDGKITAKEYDIAFGEKRPGNYIPTEKDAIQYGKFIAEKTQFLFGPLETPHAMSGPIAKTMFQFQTFATKQSEFVAQMLTDKEYAKLGKYLIGSSLLFYYIGSMLGMKWNESFQTFRWGLPPVLSFVADMWRMGIKGEDKWGNNLDWNEQLSGMGKSLFTNVVPMGAQMRRSYQGFNAVNQGAVYGKAPEGAERGAFKYRVAQTPMNYFRGTLFGKYNLPEAKEYYKNRENKGKKSLFESLFGGGGNLRDRYSGI